MTRRMRAIEGTNKVVPSATTTKVKLCDDPNCGHVHLVGYDDEGEPFCEIVVGHEIFQTIGIQLQRMDRLK